MGKVKKIRKHGVNNAKSKGRIKKQSKERPIKIPPGFVDNLILQIPRLRICANCNIPLTGQSFNFAENMSYINTNSVSQVFAKVYPRDWAILNRSISNRSIDSQSLCLKCIVELNKIYKAFLRFEKTSTTIQNILPPDIEMSFVDEESSTEGEGEEDISPMPLLKPGNSSKALNKKPAKIQPIVEPEMTQEISSIVPSQPFNRNTPSSLLKVYSCPNCLILFRSQSRAIGHIEVCGTPYSPIDSLAKLDYIYCKYSNCLSNFSSSKNYKEHLKTEHKMKFENILCGICSNFCRMKLDLMNHFKLFHPDYEKAILFDKFTHNKIIVSIKFREKSKSPDNSRPRRSRAKNTSYKEFYASSEEDEDEEYQNFRIKSFERRGISSNDSESSSNSEEGDPLVKDLNLNCWSCKMAFKNSNDLKSHKIICKREADLRYEQSLNSTSSQFPIQVNVFEAKFKCQFGGCNIVKATLDDINSHMSSHTDFKPWICGLCNSQFKFKISLRNHLKISHADSDSSPVKPHAISPSSKVEETSQVSIICPLCDFESDIPNQLRAHVKSVHGIEAFLCEICNDFFKREENLRNHMKEKHATENDLTGEDSTNSSSAASKPEKVPIGTTCEKEDDNSEPNVPFLNPIDVNAEDALLDDDDDVLMESEDLVDPLADPLGEMDYTPKLKDFVHYFKTTKSTDSHEQIADPGPDYVPENESGVNQVPDSEKVACKICQTIVKKSYLKTHLRKMHPGPRSEVDEAEVHSCELCNSPFNVRFLFVKHLKFFHHLNETKIEELTKYYCEICDVNFNWKPSLNNHLNSNGHQLCAKALNTSSR